MNNYIVVIFLSVLLVFPHQSLSAPVSQTASANMVCVNDLDNDGYAGEEGEATSCTSNASGSDYYCPIQAVACEEAEKVIAEPSVDSCPDDFTMSDDGEVCVKTGYERSEPSLNCPNDYVYNTVTKTCQKDVVVTEPSVKTCPSGYNMTADEKFCVRQNTVQTSPSFSCPSGYSYYTATGTCRKAVTKTTSPSYSCPSGQKLRDNKCYTTLSGEACGDDSRIPKSCAVLPGVYGVNKFSSGGGGYMYTYSWVWDGVAFAYYYYSNVNMVKYGSHYYIEEYAGPGDWSAICQCPEFVDLEVGNARRSCPSGYSYNSGTGQCQDSDIVQTSPSISCPSGYSYNTSTKKCENTVVDTIAVTPSCPSGYTYNEHIDQCEDEDTVSADPTRSCPTGYSYNPTANLCEKEIVTTVAVTHDCPTDYSYSSSSGQCELIQIYDACPLSGGGSCVLNPVDNTPYCSPNPCFDRATEVTVDKIDGSMLVDNGERNEEGQCIDQLMVFSGRASECQRAGVSTAFKSCCSSDAIKNDSMGSMSEMRYATQTIEAVYQVTTAAYGAYTSAISSGATQTAALNAASGAASNQIALLMNPATIAWAIAIYFIMDYLMSACDPMSVETAMESASGMCHKVGEYCKKEWLGDCVQVAASFCCFNSKMGRIIHEQGREQLETFDGWGDPSSPDCRGFTPEEFRALDFSRIDMSEYYEDLVYETQEDITKSIKETTEGYFDSVQ